MFIRKYIKTYSEIPLTVKVETTLDNKEQKELLLQVIYHGKSITEIKFPIPE